jgi:hypothetical protein
MDRVAKSVFFYMKIRATRITIKHILEMIYFLRQTMSINQFLEDMKKKIAFKQEFFEKL